jgi:hypothetical protein
MVARTTGETFAEIGQAVDAPLSRSDKAPRIARSLGKWSTRHAPSAQITARLAFYFF